MTPILYNWCIREKKITVPQRVQQKPPFICTHLFTNITSASSEFGFSSCLSPTNVNSGERPLPHFSCTHKFENCPALYRCGHWGGDAVTEGDIFQIKPKFLLFCIFIMNLRNGFVLKYGRLWTFVAKSTCVFSWTTLLFSIFFFLPMLSSKDGFSYPRNKNFAKRKLRLLQELETNFRRRENFRLKPKSLILPITLTAISELPYSP